MAPIDAPLFTDGQADRPEHRHDDFVVDCGCNVKRVVGSVRVAVRPSVDDAIPKVLHCFAFGYERDVGAIAGNLCEVKVGKLLKQARQKTAIAVKSRFTDGMLYDDIRQSGTMHEAMDDFWGLAQARRVELSIDDVLPQALVRGDRALLLRAVCNLIDNALKYTASGGRVRVSLQRDGMNWLIHIADSGMGIAQEDLPRIFQPFTRVGPAARNDGNGAGLGLAFVNTVAARHGGSVEVQSQPGSGSTFTLRLLAYTEDEIARADERVA